MATRNHVRSIHSRRKNSCCRREGLSGVWKLPSEDLIMARQKVARCTTEFINVYGLVIGMGRNVDRRTPPRGYSGNKDQCIPTIINGDLCALAYGTRAVDNKRVTCRIHCFLHE